MEEKEKEELLKLLEEAKQHVEDGENDKAIDKIKSAEDKLKRPIGGGNNGRPSK